ncbi:MAG TPA: hypothetical protein VIS09_22315 [Streptomyces sp.]
MLPFVPLLLSGVLLTACSGGSPEGGSGGVGATGEKGRGLVFAKCMREHGVKKFPDPGDDGGQMIGKDSGIDPKSPKFMQAQEACKDLMPQAEKAEGGKPADLAKAREWAKCVRENGVTKFPDPEIDGNTAVVDMTGVPDEEGGPLDKALETCEDKRPSGNLQMRANGGGQ